ncbi:nucleoprotein [Lone Star virus]|uniref:Nucleoprotein n=1 Tax=Lone Star virus TaxID=1219465 RepID=R4P2G7_9VIRU|nr:nucleoprotein [Lone Star virus]AGL50924.1 nucleoprotein [Lone Star virus]
MTSYSEILEEFGLSEIDNTQLARWEELFAYEGFDPVKMLAKMKKLAPDDWRDDVKIIIVFALTRGNKMSKAANKMSDKGKTELMRLKARYNLVENPQSRDDITPTRVASALPTWTVRAAAALKDSLPMGPAAIKANAEKTIPAEMCCAAFAGVIPTSGIAEEDTEAITKAFFVWQYYFTQLINPQMRGKKKEVIFSSFDAAVRAAMNSASYPNKSRIDFLQGLGILNQKKKAVESVRALAELWDEME